MYSINVTKWKTSTRLCADESQYVFSNLIYLWSFSYNYFVFIFLRISHARFASFVSRLRLVKITFDSFIWMLFARDLFAREFLKSVKQNDFFVLKKWTEQIWRFGKRNGRKNVRKCVSMYVSGIKWLFRLHVIEEIRNTINFNRCRLRLICFAKKPSFDSTHIRDTISLSLTHVKIINRDVFTSIILKCNSYLLLNQNLCNFRILTFQIKTVTIAISFNF